MRDYQRHQSARMFDNGLLEAASRVHPVVPFLFYLPLVLGLLAYGLTSGTSSFLQTGVFFPAGVVVWDLMEYSIHRYFFHWEGNGPLGRRIHEIAHGYHHKYPDDPLRLVMPLGASLPGAIVVGGLLFWLGRPGQTVPLFAGILAGYLFYDFMHWSTHYRKPLTAWGRELRAHHMAHHFSEPNLNFGISHRWLDRLFGTLKRRAE